ncbi:LysR family transcriptional regulator [Hydrogenophaga laconesensis]|uniref:LysR family nitrogen assimilation transcriptional regulator n=1 Tax=Hydrogenophaga laconesensis TaxID=1805971 RepID=A0ABU1VBB6_9BURK|nr:LysR family transcriptional regulator [Hydrogenophaga laconesensis]MDR7094610.1 LysR family nitrogen assimilation transcriptional regulator [Hydrogenophaga laconesensis]
MKHQQLRYFLQIASSGSMTKAAAALHIAQPALSRQMQLLEEELGISLFERSTKGVRLTPSGELLRKRGNALALQHESVVDELRSQSGSEASFSLIVPPSLHEFITVPLVSRFLKENPSQLLKVNEAASAVIDVTLWLESAQAHLAIVAGPRSTAALSALPLVVEPLCAVTSLDRGLQLDAPVSLSSIVSVPLAIPTRPNSIRVIVDRACGEQGVVPPVCLEVNSKQLALDLAEAGSVTAILPYSAIYFAVADGRLSAAPIVGMVIEWSMVRSRNRYFPNIGEHVEAMATDIAEKRVASGSWGTAYIPTGF